MLQSTEFFPWPELRRHLEAAAGRATRWSRRGRLNELAGARGVATLPEDPGRGVLRFLRVSQRAQAPSEPRFPVDLQPRLERFLSRAPAIGACDFRLRGSRGGYLETRTLGAEETLDLRWAAHGSPAAPPRWKPVLRQLLKDLGLARRFKVKSSSGQLYVSGRGGDVGPVDRFPERLGFRIPLDAGDLAAAVAGIEARMAAASGVESAWAVLSTLKARRPEELDRVWAAGRDVMPEFGSKVWSVSLLVEGWEDLRAVAEAPFAIATEMQAATATAAGGRARIAVFVDSTRGARILLAGKKPALPAVAAELFPDLDLEPGSSWEL